jgi:hypothetical protein
MYKYINEESEEEEEINEEEDTEEEPPAAQNRKYKIGFYYDFKTYKQPIKRLIYIIEPSYCFLKVVNIPAEFVEYRNGFNLYKWNISADNVNLNSSYIIKKSDVKPYKANISLIFSIFYKDENEIKRLNDESPQTKREPDYLNLYELNYNYFEC